VVGAELGSATGPINARQPLTKVVRHSPGSRRLTPGADKDYDVHEFVDDLRDLNVTPHIVRTPPTAARRSAPARRATSATISKQRRKLTEEPFGWAKTIRGLARSKLRGANTVEIQVHLPNGSYDLSS
jgi:hypothetical protein